MDRIDLHTHSFCSDGTLTPAELIQYAEKKGLRAIALTDHDTVEGLDEARQAAGKTGIEFIPGIELSSYYQGRDLHFVGLDIDDKNRQLQKELYEIRHSRDIRNHEMIDKMRGGGVDISMNKLTALEGDAVLTRANFANYLIHVGFVRSRTEAFAKYLDKDGLFYVPRRRITPEYAINFILRYGGIPILAHPLLYKYTLDELDAAVKYLTAFNLKGIEVYYSMNHGFDEVNVKRLADKYHLRYSGGSDYHGANKPHIDLGCGRGDLSIPYTVLEKLRQ